MRFRLSLKTHASVAALIATGAIFVTWPAAANEAEHEHVLGDRLGTVEFAVGCAEPVREDFNRA